ncbi:MAG: hypothetical protein IT289_06915, partial [Oligoflexia bacterium]|nr:hypothetical protein [Oligoflexia bacterium]
MPKDLGQNVNDLQDSRPSSMARAAFGVGLGTLTSRLLGFLRDVLVLHYFSRTATDAFVVAFRLPNLFRRVFGEGALNVAFIPVLTDLLRSEDRREAREFISALFTLLFTVLSAVTLLGIFNSDFLISTLTLGDRGFGQVAGKLELTAQMARIMFGYILLVSLYAFFMGILNTFRIFWLPAVAPALWNISVIVAVLFFRNSFEEPAFALAWATLIGGVAQMVLLIPKLVEIGFFPKIRNWFGNPSVKRVLWAMGPSLIGLSVTQIAIIINTYFASSLS